MHVKNQIVNIVMVSMPQFLFFSFKLRSEQLKSYNLLNHRRAETSTDSIRFHLYSENSPKWCMNLNATGLLSLEFRSRMVMSAATTKRWEGIVMAAIMFSVGQNQPGLC